MYDYMHNYIYNYQHNPYIVYYNITLSYYQKFYNFLIKFKPMSMKQTRMSYANIVFTKNMKICNEAYTLTNKIGHGNFGDVYMGIKNPSKNQKKCKMVGIKIQKQIPGRSVSLLNQIEILKTINRDPHMVGFPEIYEHGFQKGNHFIIMELLGPNLNDLMKMCGGKFSLGTTVVLGLQIFERIEYLHSIGYVCKDIKPQNFLMGTDKKSSMLYLIDFGLSKRYRDPRVNLHIPYRQQRDFSGTLRYASICSHLRIEHARRDDLESICYMLIYFLLGTLPWQSNSYQTGDAKERFIIQKKMKISPAQLCANIPLQFKNILEYCMELDYYQQPDYQFIHGQLLQLYDKILTGQEFQYDWMLFSAEKTINKEDLIMKVSPHDVMKEICENFDEDGDQNEQKDDDEEEDGGAAQGNQNQTYQFDSDSGEA